MYLFRHATAPLTNESWCLHVLVSLAAIIIAIDWVPWTINIFLTVLEVGNMRWGMAQSGSGEVHNLGDIKLTSPYIFTR